MSLPRKITSGSEIYIIVDDLTLLYQALIVGTVVDAVSGKPLSARFSLITNREGFYHKTVENGLYCLAGNSQRLFPALDTTAYSVTITVQAAGYQSTSLTVPVPIGASFPQTAPAINLRPLPVRLQGRVVRNTPNSPPVANCLIRLVGPNPPAPLSGQVIALRTPLHFAHAAGVTIQERSLTSVGAAGAKQLQTPAQGDDTVLRLNDRTGLSAGAILQIGEAFRGEYAVIATTPSDPGVPGPVELQNPLNQSFPANTPVQLYSLGAVGVGTTLLSPAEAGDGILNLAAGLNGTIIEVADPIPTRTEYHAVGALTDAAGFYHLDGIGRLHTVQLQASNPPALPIVNWTIQYGTAVNLVNFRI